MPPMTPESLPLVLSVVALLVSVTQAILARHQAVSAARAVFLQQQRIELEGQVHEVRLLRGQGAVIEAEVSTGASHATIRGLSLQFECRYPDNDVFFMLAQHHHYIWHAPADEAWLFFDQIPSLPHRMEPNDLWKLTLPGLYFIEKKADELADMRVSLTAETTNGSKRSTELQVVWRRSYGGIKFGSTGLRWWDVPFLSLYEQAPRDVVRMVLMAMGSTEGLELIIVAMHLQQSGALGDLKYAFKIFDFKPGGPALRQPSRQQLIANTHATLKALRASLGDTPYAHKIALVEIALQIRDSRFPAPAPDLDLD